MHEALSVSVSASYPKCTSIAVASCSNRALERCYGMQVADETRTLIGDRVHETGPEQAMPSTRSAHHHERGVESHASIVRRGKSPRTPSGA